MIKFKLHRHRTEGITPAKLYDRHLYLDNLIVAFHNDSW